jgi:hypothetical protein
MRMVTQIGPVCLILCVLASFAVGQGTLSQPPPGRPVTFQSPSSVPDKNRELLDSDPRFKIKMTISKRSVSLSDALRTLSGLSKIPFLVDDNEGATRRLSFSFNDMSLADIIDGIAALYHYELEVRKSGVLVFRPEAATGQESQSLPEQKDIARAGSDFETGLEKLPPSLKDALDRGGEVTVKDLPPAMQTAAQSMLSSHLSQMNWGPNSEAMGRLGDRLLGNFSNTNVRWQTNGDMCSFSIGMHNVGGMSMSFRRPKK